MFKHAFAAVAATTPFLASAAFAGPYVESKTTAAAVDGSYRGAQTELRVGYEEKTKGGTTIFGEIGPGYEWTKLSIVTGKQIGRAHV